MLVRRSVRTDDDCYRAFYELEKLKAFEPASMAGTTLKNRQTSCCTGDTGRVLTS